jgi:hypothetical protein
MPACKKKIAIRPSIPAKGGMQTIRPFVLKRLRTLLWCSVLLLLPSSGLLAECIPPQLPQKGPTVAGNRAVLKGKTAYAPANAPQNIKVAIWATNTLANKPYVWGGGHGTFYDRGYDCSGTISFFLHHSGVLDQPTPSKAFLSYGECGPGKWVTIYARAGHVFAYICGLRLDTTGLRQEEGPRWRPDYREPRGFMARHPAGM